MEVMDCKYDSLDISCVQFEPVTADYDRNMTRMLSFVELIMAKRPQTDLIVFPELSTTGYMGTREEFDQNAYTLANDPCAARMAQLTARYRVTVAYGFAERDPEDPAILYNAAAVVSGGKVLGSYRKVHPFDSEKVWCTPGNDYPVFDTDFGKLGVMICWDSAFPEVARIYALKGAQAIAVCTNWETSETDVVDPHKERNWELVLRARAFDNFLPIGMANRVGNDRGCRFFGHSKIFDFLGDVKAACEDSSESILHASVSMRDETFRRDEYQVILDDRRPDTYGELIRSKE